VPGVVTIVLPPEQNSSDYGQNLQKAGFLLSFNSDYLRRRNWIQICLMGEYSVDKIEALLTWLSRHPLATVKQPSVHAAVSEAS
jgi:predicted DNA-binding protein (MmcQ/YjbR family)